MGEDGSGTHRLHLATTGLIVGESIGEGTHQILVDAVPGSPAASAPLADGRRARPRRQVRRLHRLPARLHRDAGRPDDHVDRQRRRHARRPFAGATRRRRRAGRRGAGRAGRRRRRRRHTAPWSRSPRRPARLPSWCRSTERRATTLDGVVATKPPLGAVATPEPPASTTPTTTAAAPTTTVPAAPPPVLLATAGDAGIAVIENGVEIRRLDQPRRDRPADTGRRGDLPAGPDDARRDARRSPDLAPRRHRRRRCSARSGEPVVPPPRHRHDRRRPDPALRRVLAGTSIRAGRSPRGLHRGRPRPADDAGRLDADRDRRGQHVGGRRRPAVAQHRWHRSSARRARRRQQRVRSAPSCPAHPTAASDPPSHESLGIGPSYSECDASVLAPSRSPPTASRSSWTRGRGDHGGRHGVRRAALVERAVAGRHAMRVRGPADVARRAHVVRRRRRGRHLLRLRSTRRSTPPSSPPPPHPATSSRPRSPAGSLTFGP